MRAHGGDGHTALEPFDSTLLESVHTSSNFDPDSLGQATAHIPQRPVPYFKGKIRGQPIVGS